MDSREWNARYAEREQTFTPEPNRLVVTEVARMGGPGVALDVARLFEHVLVDEYQDTNPLQAQILQSLRPEGVNRNVMVVGDDAQAIYAFRGASVRNILYFPLHFPGARRITLEQNYRSTRPILDASNAVIAQARERFPKNLWTVRSGGARPVLLTCVDEVEQSTRVCEQVLWIRSRCHSICHRSHNLSMQMFHRPRRCRRRGW